VEIDLISKKDLLVAKSISYGQLYRWKRKGLIPEDWFVRKSTFTGQETFFPRDKMLARVDRILGMKSEDVALDDIAVAVAPKLDELTATIREVGERGLVSQPALDLFADGRDPDARLAVGELVSLETLDGLLATGDISLDEGVVVLETLEARYPGFEGGAADLLVIRKLGTTTALLVPSGAELGLDPKARLVARIDLSERSEALGRRLTTSKE
jgi:hypothetical protein